MERLKISGFIFAVILILAGICAVFPEDGVRFAGMTLRFPGLKEVLADDGSGTAVTEDLEARLHVSEDDALPAGPARLHMPDSDPDCLNSFFEALDSASVMRVNIVHYGDSQIEEDRMTSIIRDIMQDRFGGGGTGLLPAKSYFTMRSSVYASGEKPCFMVYGDPEMRAGNNRYGPMGQFTRTDSVMTVSVRPARNSSVKGFNRLSVYTSASLGVSGKGARTKESGAMCCTSFELQDSSLTAAFSTSGEGDIYGFSTYRDKGISVDNIPMRGCSGTIFTAISQAQLKSYFTQSNTRLIIMQYGGNGIPYMKTPKAMSDYSRSVQRQISQMKSAAPEASIIFIGPSDMATTTGGKRVTYSYLPEFVDTLKAGVNKAGAAYWDMFSAMGGEGSMVAWVKAQPALAGPDYIHFTRLGAERMGTLFAETLLKYHDRYRKRRHE